MLLHLFANRGAWTRLRFYWDTSLFRFMLWVLPIFSPCVWEKGFVVKCWNDHTCSCDKCISLQLVMYFTCSDVFVDKFRAFLFASNSHVHRSVCTENFYTKFLSCFLVNSWGFISWEIVVGRGWISLFLPMKMIWKDQGGSKQNLAFKSNNSCLNSFAVSVKFSFE